MRWCGLIALLAVASLGSVSQSFAQTSTAPDLRVYPPGQLPDDPRLGELRTLNDYFPFRPVENVAAWTERQVESGVCGAMVGCSGQDLYREERNTHPFESSSGGTRQKISKSP